MTTSVAQDAARQVEELLDFFRLAEQPFSLSPDPRFLYHTENHLIAFTRCRQNIVQRQGLSVVVGDVGTGKSTVARRLFLDFTHDEVASEYATRFVKNASNWTTSNKMIQALSDEFGCPPRRSEGAQWAEFESHVQGLAAEGINVVLLIDEAQSIPKKVLIRLRELLNFEADSVKFIQIVLLGTLELRATLQDQAVRPLRSRIAGGIATLAPLALDELREAIKFRVTVAGRTKPLFNDECYPLIHAASEGVLRDAVDISRNALHLAFEDRESVISPTTVSLAVDGFDKAAAQDNG
ncbi:MAG TPA: AAA family ATPase [Blastocatellia bacterium]|nr:AAA family ATPase [Blastocatellia bacterium]